MRPATATKAQITRGVRNPYAKTDSSAMGSLVFGRIGARGVTEDTNRRIFESDP